MLMKSEVLLMITVGVDAYEGHLSKGQNAVYVMLCDGLDRLYSVKYKLCVIFSIEM